MQLSKGCYVIHRHSCWPVLAGMSATAELMSVSFRTAMLNDSREQTPTA